MNAYMKLAKGVCSKAQQLVELQARNSLGLEATNARGTGKRNPDTHLSKKPGIQATELGFVVCRCVTVYFDSKSKPPQTKLVEEPHT